MVPPDVLLHFANGPSGCPVRPLLLSQLRVTRSGTFAREIVACFLSALSGSRRVLRVEDMVNWSHLSLLWRILIESLLPYGLMAVAIAVLVYAVVVDRLFTYAS